MAFRLSCPSCNSSFAIPELPTDRRATCPRCSDVFPIRSFSEEASTSEKMRPSTAERRARGRWSVRRTATVAAAMGLMGLVAGLSVYYFQGGFQSKPEPLPEPALVVEVIPPSRLIGLGYLPADTNLSFAIQPGPALAYADRVKQDPQELFTRTGIPRQLFGTIKTMGLSLSQIDHLAGGIGVGERGFTFVLVLRRPPADEDELLKKLKARPLPGPKARYEVSVEGLPFVPTLARVSPTIWVFGLDSKKDLEAVDHGGYGAGGKHFPQPMAEMIAQRLPPDAAAWVATSDESWADQPLVPILLGQLVGKQELSPAVGKARGLAMALSLEQPPRLRLFLKTVDAETGQQVRAYFARKATSDDQVRHGGAGGLAFLDMPIEPSRTLATLQQFLIDAGQK